MWHYKWSGIFWFIHTQVHTCTLCTIPSYMHSSMCWCNNTFLITTEVLSPADGIALESVVSHMSRSLRGLAGKCVELPGLQTLGHTSGAHLHSRNGSNGDTPRRIVLFLELWCSAVQSHCLYNARESRLIMHCSDWHTLYLLLFLLVSSVHVLNTFGCN